MSQYLIRRLMQAVPTFFGVTIIVFILINSVPGGPTGDMALDPNIKAEDIARIRASMGLDKPLYEQYFIYMGNLFRGDLGVSLIQRGAKVSDMILERVPATLSLTLSALFLALCIAVPLGVLSAVKQYSLFDNIATMFSTAGVAVPTFWLSILMIILFAVTLRWFPTGGTQTLGQETDFGDRIWHLAMPASALALVSIASWNRYIRASMLEVIRQDFIRTARAKGLRERFVVFKHALRNALIPFATLLGLSLPNIIGGALIIERVFSWPGIGRLAFDKAQQRDYPVIMAVVMMSSVLVILGNLAADMAYSFLDPRIKQN